MSTKKIIGVGLVLGGMALLKSRNTKPKKAKPITNFDVNRYLGTWYEIARFDYRFEKSIDNATADYSLNEDGTVKVINRGYDTKKMKWTTVYGKAKFRNKPTRAALKVRFFGPFYSAYNVIALDKNYQYALIAGKSLDYLWLLSRNTNMPENIKRKYLRTAKKVGYDTSRLIWVNHDKSTSKIEK